MTEFSKNELLRLVDTIPETDPTTTAYHVLMQSIECFNSLALTVDEILALRDGSPANRPAEKVKEIAQDNVVPFTAPDFPADTKDEVPEGCLHVVVPRTDEPPVEDKTAEEKTVEEKTYAASDVRKALVEVKAKGVDVKEILSEFGVTDFRALPAAKYNALMMRLEAM